MKTKELIRQLQQADPGGELEVSVGNIDIFLVDTLPGYYDGVQQVLVRDEAKKPYYDVVGGRYNASQDKVVIHTLSFSDAMWDNTDFAIDYSGLSDGRKEAMQKAHEKYRQSVSHIVNVMEMGNFRDFVKKKAEEFTSELDEVNEVADKFYTEHLNRDDPIPADIPVVGNSYVDRRHLQWERQIEVLFDDGIAIRQRVLPEHA
mgnify:CR=1 FL=1